MKKRGHIRTLLTCAVVLTGITLAVPVSAAGAPSPDDGTTVAPEATETTVVPRGTALVAIVVAADGSGTPTGVVNFAVDGVDAGTATLAGGEAQLPQRVPALIEHEITARYNGDDTHAGSTATVKQQHPTLEAALSSKHPVTEDGWFRAPVFINYTCQPGFAPLLDPCPGPVKVGLNGAYNAMQTLHAVDGGWVTISTSFSVDRVDPVVRLRGVKDGRVYRHAPKPKCVAKDVLSGLKSCQLIKHKLGTTVSYRAVATDKAGNTAVARASYIVRPSAG